MQFVLNEVNEVETECFTIRNKDYSYTEEYREFLKDYFSDLNEAYSFVFLKGYQWPFSFERADKSSLIDIAVHSETSKGRKVYLDYTKNPENFCFES